MTGPVTSSSSGSTGESETETGAPDDLPGCDPFVDPELECGPEMTCDLTLRTCTPATGTGLLDDPCAATEECSPGLVCAGDRCRQPCDPKFGTGCNTDAICRVTTEPISGLCLERCELAFDSCSVAGDACKRVIDPGGQTQAACVENPGAGLAGDACEADIECWPGYLCVPEQFHTLPCANLAARCCTPICDLDELFCLGLEPACYTLEIPGQESAGFCGAG